MYVNLEAIIANLEKYNDKTEALFDDKRLDYNVREIGKISFRITDDCPHYSFNTGASVKITEDVSRLFGLFVDAYVKVNHYSDMVPYTEADAYRKTMKEETLKIEKVNIDKVEDCKSGHRYDITVSYVGAAGFMELVSSSFFSVMHLSDMRVSHRYDTGVSSSKDVVPLNKDDSDNLYKIKTFTGADCLTDMVAWMNRMKIRKDNIVYIADCNGRCSIVYTSM